MWIGANGQNTEGEFVWKNTGLNVIYANWGPGQPTNFTCENCVCIVKYGAWHDANCIYQSPFV